MAYIPVEAAKSQKSSHICELDTEEIVEWLIQRGGLDSRYVRHLYSPLLQTDPLEMVIIGTVAELEVKGRRPTFVSQSEVLERTDQKYHDQVITKIGELVRREILRRNPDDGSEVRIMLPIFRDWFNDNKPEYKLWAPLLRR